MLDDNRTGLNGAVRQLFARLAPGTAAPSPRPVLWEPDAGGEAGPRDRAPCTDEGRRARAHAAFRSVTGSEQAALDAALAVEVARLRGTVIAYGEALKEIEAYGRDSSVRGTAAAALRRAPERLQAPEPAPHLARGGLYG